MTLWNPRFLAYAQSRGMTPEAVLSADRIAFPGGRMAGFIVWNMRRITEYLAETRLPRASLVTNPEQYDGWLARRYAPGQLALALEAA